MCLHVPVCVCNAKVNVGSVVPHALEAAGAVSEERSEACSYSLQIVPFWFFFFFF